MKCKPNCAPGGTLSKTRHSARSTGNRYSAGYLARFIGELLWDTLNSGVMDLSLKGQKETPGRSYFGLKETNLQPEKPENGKPHTCHPKSLKQGADGALLVKAPLASLEVALTPENGLEAAFVDPPLDIRRVLKEY